MRTSLSFYKLLCLTFVTVLLYGCQAASSAATPLTQAAGQTETVVKLETARPTTAVNQTVEVSAWIENVENLYGVELQLIFDNQRLMLLDGDDTQTGVQVRPGDFLSPDFVARNEGHDGDLIFVATQLPPQTPVNGDGVLMTMQFRVMQPGEAAITLQQALLASPEGEPIPTQMRNLTLTVKE